jgi:hypothetical protein
MDSKVANHGRTQGKIAERTDKPLTTAVASDHTAHQMNTESLHQLNDPSMIAHAPWSSSLLEINPVVPVAISTGARSIRVSGTQGLTGPEQRVILFHHVDIRTG